MCRGLPPRLIASRRLRLRCLVGDGYRRSNPSAALCKEPAGEARERRAAHRATKSIPYSVTQLFHLALFLWRKERDSFCRWRLGRLVCVWLLFAVANLCLCLMIVFENKLSAIISQSQQSSIATAPLRSPLGCCDRSNLVRALMEQSGKTINRLYNNFALLHFFCSPFFVFRLFCYLCKKKQNKLQYE